MFAQTPLIYLPKRYRSAFGAQNSRADCEAEGRLPRTGEPRAATALGVTKLLSRLRLCSEGPGWPAAEPRSASTAERGTSYKAQRATLLRHLPLEGHLASLLCGFISHNVCRNLRLQGALPTGLGTIIPTSQVEGWHGDRVENVPRGAARLQFSWFSIPCSSPRPPAASENFKRSVAAAGLPDCEYKSAK